MGVLTDIITFEDDFITATTFNGNLTTVRVTHKGTGIAASAHALKVEEDFYDRTIGFDLAHARAMSRVWAKLSRRAIAATK